MPVRGYNDLLVLLIKRVEGVKERFLSLDLAFQKLYVVDKENVVLPVALLKVQRCVVSDGVDKVVGKVFAGHVPDPHARLLVLDVLPDGVKQVCLSETYATVDEERIVDDSGRLGDRQGCGMSEAVAGADDEGVEGVLDLEGARRASASHELCAIQARPILLLHPAGAGFLDADYQLRIFFAEGGGECLLQERFETALYVLFCDWVLHGDLQPTFIEISGSRTVDPDPQGRSTQVPGDAFEHLCPNLFCGALHGLLHPGVDYGLYQIPT